MNFTDTISAQFKACFPNSEGPDNNPWAPKVICRTCQARLRRWKTGLGRMIFSLPMSWREPENHERDCYFCRNVKFGINFKTRKSLNYVVTSSVTMPVIVEVHADERMVIDGEDEEGREMEPEENQPVKLIESAIHKTDYMKAR